MNDLYIGIDLGGTFLKAGLCDASGKVHNRKSIKTKSDEGKDLILSDIMELVNYFKKKAENLGIIKAFGMGVPGLVDINKGIIYELTNIPGWRNIPIREILEAKTGLPCYVDNDVNVMTLGEFRYGAARGADNVIGLTLGTGVGGGLIINGHLYRGSTMSAGEIGHVNVEKKGRPCNCGSFGCLEQYVGNKQIVERAIEKINAGKEPTVLRDIVEGNLELMTPKILSAAAERGDKVAVEVWEETGEYLGIVLAGLTNVINPDIIVIGGGVSKSGKYILKPVTKTIMARAMDVSSKAVSVVLARLGEDAGIIGGAALAKEELPL